MRLAIRLFLALLILFFGIKAVLLETGGFSLGVFDELQDIPFAILLLLTLAVILIDLTCYRTYHHILQFSISALGLSLVFFAGLKMAQHYRIDTAPSVLKVRNLPGAPQVIEMEFKKGRRFRLTEYDPDGETRYYGSYRRTGDSIRVTATNYPGHGGSRPRLGLLRGDTLRWQGFEPMLVAP